MSDEEFEVEVAPVESIEWQWSFAGYLVGRMSRDVLAAVTTALDDVQTRLAAHHNWLVDQRNFAEEARQQIESIPSTDD